MTDTISARLVDNAKRGGYEQPSGRLVMTLADHIDAQAKAIKVLVEALEAIENVARAPQQMYDRNGPEKEAPVPCLICGKKVKARAWEPVDDYPNNAVLRFTAVVECYPCEFESPGRSGKRYKTAEEAIADATKAWNAQAAMAAPKIKKLVWEVHPCGTLARTGFYGATYLITGLDTPHPYFMNWPSRDSWPKITHADEGKALAQADYEARWLAALDPLP